MRPDLERPILADRPLISNVESLQGARSGLPEEYNRDDTIISSLRKRLREQTASNTDATGGRRASDKKPAGEEDKYEPQRISRKICWQYDNTARKIPLLRRHYI